MKKRILSILLAALMIVSLLPTVALAEWSGTGTGTQSDPWKIGTTGNENTVTAYLDDGTLSIEGTGAMQDFASVISPLMTFSTASASGIFTTLMNSSSSSRWGPTARPLAR